MENLPSLSKSGVKAYRWLFFEGVQSTIIPNNMTENKRCQNASSIHKSRQSGNKEENQTLNSF